MSSSPDQTGVSIPLLSLRAWVEFRDSTTDPAACDISNAALVAAAVLSDVRDIRDSHGDALLDTPAGSSSRRLANDLNSTERLALAAQRLGVEALTARLRHDQGYMATTCADMFWHLSEVAELLNGIAELRPAVAGEADSGTSGLSIVDVDDEVEIIDLERTELPAGDEPIDLRTAGSGRPAGSTGSDGARGRIVAAAMGVAPSPSEPLTDPGDEANVSDPSDDPSDGPVATDDVSVDPAAADPTPAPAWEPPQGVFVPFVHGRPAIAGSWRARRRELRRERALIVDDERTRGRGLRPRLPTWFSQGVATLLICVLLALVAIGVWMLVGNDAGPF